MNTQKLQEFISLQAQISALTKQLDLIKSEIRNSVAIGKTTLEGFEISKSQRFRVDLDKEKVLLAMGADAYKECEKISEYEVLMVKKI